MASQKALTYKDVFAGQPSTIAIESRGVPMAIHNNLTWKDISDRFHGLKPEHPEGRWGHEPETLQEQLQYKRHTDRLRRELVDEVLATRRYIDLKPRPEEEERLLRLYTIDKGAPGSEVLLGEVAQACERMRDYSWRCILDRLEQAHRGKESAAEQDLATIAKGGKLR